MKKMVMMMAIVFACGLTFAAPVKTTDEKPQTEQTVKKDKKESCCSEKKTCDKKEKSCCEKKTEKTEKTEKE